MKFTAVVPVTKMETRTYDIYVPEDVQKVIKAYEKWYDDMSKENETNLINAIKVAELNFDEKTNNFEDYANEIIDDIRWNIYNREKKNGSAEVYEIDDIQGLADGDFNFIWRGGRGDFTPRPLFCAAGHKIYKMSSLDFVILAARFRRSSAVNFQTIHPCTFLFSEFSDNSRPRFPDSPR